MSDALGQALRLADRLNCSTAENSSPLQTLLQCLKRLPFKELIEYDDCDDHYVHYIMVMIMIVAMTTMIKMTTAMIMMMIMITIMMMTIMMIKLR